MSKSLKIQNRKTSVAFNRTPVSESLVAIRKVTEDLRSLVQLNRNEDALVELTKLLLTAYLLTQVTKALFYQLTRPRDLITNDMSQGKIIKLLRIKKNLTQKQLAQKTDVTANYVSLVESGDRTPSLSFIKKVADVLGISANLLLWEDVDLSKFKDKDSRALAEKINQNLIEIKQLLFNQIIDGSKSA